MVRDHRQTVGDTTFPEIIHKHISFPGGKTATSGVDINVYTAFLLQPKSRKKSSNASGAQFVKCHVSTPITTTLQAGALNLVYLEYFIAYPSPLIKIV